MKTRTPLWLYLVLFAYIAVSLTYQVVGAVSLVTGYFELRPQVTEPIQTVWNEPVVTGMSDAAATAGLRKGDLIESIGGVPFVGKAVMQSARWHARPGGTMDLTVLHANGARVSLAIPLIAANRERTLREAVSLIVLQLAVPLLCLFLGYWVALARPADLNAWLMLILLSYPQSFLTTSVNAWWPDWLALRLFWHLAVSGLAPLALIWLGLLFPERSRIDVRWPWLKWLFLGTLALGLTAALLADYVVWYAWRFYPDVRLVDEISTRVLLATMILSVVLYTGAIFAKLRTASTADARRRLRVLSIGSVAGLGTNLIIWAVLPRFGFDPTKIHWLGYASSVLMFIFPLALAYVVVVQRAMDVRLLLRMGTKYLLARTSLAIVQFLVLGLITFRFVLPLFQGHHERELTVFVPVAFIVLLVRLNFVKRSLWDRLREKIDKRFFREEYNTEHILTELAESVRGITEPAPLLHAVSVRVSEVLHIPRMAVLLRHGDMFHVLDGPALGEASTPVRHLVGSSAPAVLYRDRPQQWYLDATEAERRALDEMNAEVLLPLAGRTKLMGVMVLGSKLSEQPYSPTDLRLLASVGTQVGLGLEINDLAQSLAHEAARGERMAREVEIAREVQQRLFPQNIPCIPGLDLAGHCRPALAVGGDYYDMIELEDGRLALAIGDVSGKGIGAALLMASLRASLRGMTDSASHDLARMIRKLNRLVYESSTSNRYATFFFAIYDPALRELRYVNGGHNAPFLVRAGEVLRLEATGPVVGLLKDIAFEEQMVRIEPGDMFIGYTDGISEAMTTDDEEWGEESLLKAAQAMRDRSAREVLDAIFIGADEFAGPAPQYDDMTVLICKF